VDDGPAITTTEGLTGPVFVAFPPSAVTLYRDRPTGSSARNLWQCEVAGLETHGDQIRADLTGELPLAADLTTVAAAELDLHPGATGLGDGEGDADPRVPRLTDPREPGLTGTRPHTLASPSCAHAISSPSGPRDLRGFRGHSPGGCDRPHHGSRPTRLR
jgi:hypothetical protein